MKKFCLFLICLVLMPIIFAGCTGSYVDVYSISYTIGNNTKTLYSEYEIEFSDRINPTDNGYEEQEVSSSIQEQSISGHLLEDKTLPVSVNVNDFVLVYNLAGYGSDSYKAKVKSININYLKVKINNNILEIIDSENNKYTIYPESYSIQYFN